MKVKCICIKSIKYGSRKFIENRIYNMDLNKLEVYIDQTYDVYLKSNFMKPNDQNYINYLEEIDILNELSLCLKPLSKIREERIDAILKIKNRLYSGFFSIFFFFFAINTFLFLFVFTFCYFIIN